METLPQFPRRARSSDWNLVPLENHFAPPFRQLQAPGYHLRERSGLPSNDEHTLLRFLAPHVPAAAALRDDSGGCPVRRFLVLPPSKLRQGREYGLMVAPAYLVSHAAILLSH